MKPEEWNPPSYADLRTANFEKHPFVCADCSKELQFKHPEFEYRGQRDHRIFLHASMMKDPLCGHCLANRIRKWFKTPIKELKSWSSKRERRVCQICEKPKITASIMWEDWLNMRFGSTHWNGHWVCKDCLCECCEKGTFRSSYTVRIGSTAYYMNEAGARIPYPEESK